MRKVDISKAVFIHLYVTQKKSGNDIARFFGIGRTTVTHYIHEFGLTPRTGKEVLANNPHNPNTPRQREAVRAAGKLRVGELNPNWKGGKAWVDHKGYHRVRRDGRYILEHRWVMEKHLKRRLSPGEDVHHINGNKTDNRVENLAVLSRTDHMKLHWANGAKEKILREGKSNNHSDNH